MAYSNKELRNIAKLRKLREARGLRIRDVAEATGVQDSCLRKYESGVYLPSPESYNKLAQFFGWDTVLIKSKVPKFPDLSSPEHLPEFLVGHVYSIKCKQASKNSFSKDFDKTGFDVDFAFRYEGRDGDLHHFTEIHGGWSRTYAVYQLIGKKIMEVE